jgi:hypothetical protein
MRAGPALGALLWVALTFPAAGRADEKLVATYGEVRTVLAFRVGDAVIAKLLPAGWEAVPYAEGPFKGADLTVDFSDGLAVRKPDGTAGDITRFAVWSIPTRKRDGSAAGAMVIGGLVSSPADAPGPYGVFAAAKAIVDREIRTDAGGISTVEEAWRFTGDSNDAIELQLKFTRGAAQPGKLDIRVYSSAKPDLYRIDHIEQATDVVRSAAVGIDRAQSAVFTASGPRLTPIFRSAELLAITSVPLYAHTVALPGD